MNTGCDEFCRAHAGAGLPGIEPGMPAPAGTGLTRRSFLLRSAGLAFAVYGGGSALRLDALEDGVASAAAARPGRALVSVFLDGGADGLSVLFPAGDARYTQLRPALALKPSAGLPFAEDSRLFWHPSLASLATLHGEGKVSAMPAIGYDHPDQSHFTSRHYWQVGATDAHLNSGWLGRFIDHVGTDANPLQGLSLGYQLAPQLATSSKPVATLDSAQSYDFRLNGVYGQPAERLRAAVGDLAHHDGSDAGIATAASTIVQSAQLRFQLRAYAANRAAAPAGVAYPATRDSFPQHLQTLAGLLGAGFPIRAVAIRASGSYDTHSAEAQPLTQGLKTTADSLLAFQRDLEARGIADRVLVHVWTEFGRRGKENASGGTDHGAAGPGFLIGTRMSGKMIGQFPGLADGSGLDRLGNLVPTADFRALYASLLEQWFETDATAVIPNAKSFQRYTVLEA